MRCRTGSSAAASQGVEVRTFHSFGYEIVREGLGWTFGGSAQKRTAKGLMKSAILEHTQLPALRNQDPLDAFLAGLRRAKMELPALSTVTVEYGDKIYPLEPIFHSYVKQQTERQLPGLRRYDLPGGPPAAGEPRAAPGIPVTLRVRAGG